MPMATPPALDLFDEEDSHPAQDVLFTFTSGAKAVLIAKCLALGTGAAVPRVGHGVPGRPALGAGSTVPGNCPAQVVEVVDETSAVHRSVRLLRTIVGCPSSEVASTLRFAEQEEASTAFRLCRMYLPHVAQSIEDSVRLTILNVCSTLSTSTGQQPPYHTLHSMRTLHTSLSPLSSPIQIAFCEAAHMSIQTYLNTAISKIGTVTFWVLFRDFLSTLLKPGEVATEITHRIAARSTHSSVDEYAAPAALAILSLTAHKEFSASYVKQLLAPVQVACCNKYGPGGWLALTHQLRFLFEAIPQAEAIDREGRQTLLATLAKSCEDLPRFSAESPNTWHFSPESSLWGQSAADRQSCTSWFSYQPKQKAC